MENDIFDPTMKIIPKEFCDNHGCHEYLLNAQAYCWMNDCMFKEELDKYFEGNKLGNAK